MGLLLDECFGKMAASKANSPTAFEVETDDFEDVALLLEPDQEQQHTRQRPSLKSRFLELFARGGPREHKGFEKLDQTEDDVEQSGRKQGTADTI